MRLILPPNLNRQSFERALRAFAGVVGEKWVFSSDEDRESYLDAFSMGAGDDHAPSAAVSAESREQVQAIVRIANEHKVPLWPISRGKNLAYGGSAPRMSGTVVLDLSRMRRVLELDVENAYVRVEPGVGFYDLHEHLQQAKAPLWASMPKQTWGSVVGNALERGLGESPYADHAQNICGLEVVLPQGEFLRTGMGARTNSAVWSRFKYGFGPGWDQMFCQSNFGVVTSMGMWLMPEPETTIKFACKVMTAADIEPALNAILALRRSNVIDSYMSMVSWLGIAGCFNQRAEWYDKPGPIPEDVVQRIIARMGIGWWNFDLTVFGPPEVTAAKAQIVERVLNSSGRIQSTRSAWRQGDGQAVKIGQPVPDMMPMQFINWYGGRGAHIDFSPVMPATTAAASNYFRQTFQQFNDAQHDYFLALHFGSRHIIGPTNIIYNRDDEAQVKRVKSLFGHMLDSASTNGYSEYRAHLSYMDPVADTFDYNDHALRRLNERVKDLLDPNGVLAPGKSGVWPKAYRSQRT